MNRRMEVEQSLNIPISLTTALVTGLFIIFTTFDFDSNCTLSTLFLVFYIIPLFFTGRSIWFLIVTFSDIKEKIKYKGYACLDEIVSWDEEMKEYNKNNPDLIDPEYFENYLTKNFILSASNNTRVNDRHFKNIRKSKTSIAIALIGLIIVGIPYILTPFF